MQILKTPAQVLKAKRPPEQKVASFAIVIPGLTTAGLYLRIDTYKGEDRARYYLPHPRTGKPVFLGSRERVSVVEAYASMLTAQADALLHGDQRPSVARVTLSQAFDEWMASREQTTTNELYRSFWRNHFAPHCERRLLKDLDAAVVTGVIRAAQEAGCPRTVLPRGVWFFKQLSIYAEVNHSLKGARLPPDFQLSHILGKDAPAPSTRRQVTTDEAGFRALFDLLPDDTEGDAVRFLMLTGTRKMETLAATWDEIEDLKTWTIPGERMKQGEPHTVYLMSMHREILRRSPTYKRRAERDENGKGPLVWPAKNGHGMTANRPNKLLAKLKATGTDDNGEIHRLTPHDLRRSFSTIVRTSEDDGGPGIDADLVDLMTSHNLKADALRDTYQRQAKIYAAALRRAWGKVSNWWQQLEEDAEEPMRHIQ